MKKHFPYDAAIFDLDGTLLDSMYVWHHIDKIFFERRGMTAPEDYGRALAGKSYRESAQYTIERFGFQQSWEEIVQEWTDDARHEYANHVQLKPGAKEYLTALKRAGVKLAVATALPEYLYKPCLENLGILDWFDALCSTDETGGRGKAEGEVFLLAAKRLGVDPARCAVFEDVLEGVMGAKHACMGAYCIMDPSAAHSHPKIRCIADGMIADFADLLPRRRCVIFTAHCEGNARLAYMDPREDDYILCADAGYEIAELMDVAPDWIIGDFDSSDMPEGGNVIRHPVMKDDPDTMLCVRFALEQGIRDFLIIGGLGGRMDHSIANLQTLAYIANQGGRAEMCDGITHAVMVKNGGVRLPRSNGKLSVFAYGGKCTGVYIRGAKYTLENAELTTDFPIGMGNDFAADYAEIGVEHGTLLIMREL